MLHTGRKALRAAVVAAITAALVLTAGVGVAAGTDEVRSGEDKEEQDKEDKKEKDKKEKDWTQTGIGSVITEDDGSILIVASVENSLDGDGAVVATVTLDGNTGTDTATRYQANGVGQFEEEFTLGAPDANGLIPITGSGKCVDGGTRVHKREKCEYTYTATWDPATSFITFDITGTTTR